MTALNDYLRKQLATQPDRQLVKDLTQDRWFTGATLQQDADALASALTNHLIGRHDRLVVCLENSATFWPIDQAAWSLGIAVHPLSPSTPASELLADHAEHHYHAMILTAALAAALPSDFSQATVQLAGGTLHLAFDPTLTAGRQAADQSTPTEDDIALIMHTSGTTGKPKRVGLSHRIIFNAAKHNAASNRMSETTVAMISMPLFHINGQVMAMLASRVANCQLVIAQKFSASRFWTQVADNGVTWTTVVPTMIMILLLNDKANAAYAERAQAIHLEYVRCSSFSLPEDKLQGFEQRYHTRVLEGYGMTESASQCTINPYDAPKIGSAGKPVGTTMAIRLADGTVTTAANQLGEIVAKGDHVITSYLDPHPDSFKDGWFLTGDLGYFDEDGYLFVRGRTKDIISRGGEKVAPAAVENVLDVLPFIAQLAVIGVPDELYGEAVCAVVVSRTPGVDEDQQRETLLAFGRSHLAKFEAPTQVVFVQDFPRNATGKVLRPQLRDQILGVHA
ncbi:AMP-binding protein [Lacticaseibacillus parakribbianus]|uniref:AMP-binding protein n=1 Tax=Lacticaseibacillus parakribbianus TaxID=2970927 RepID=UPI0021CB333F|nr:AMP-binding protein [Lacticaseibacillus parakribbianus]